MSRVPGSRCARERHAAETVAGLQRGAVIEQAPRQGEATLVGGGVERVVDLDAARRRA